MTESNEREMGVLSTKIANLEKQMETQGRMLTEIRDAFVSLRGGWRVMMIMSAVVGAIISWAVQILPMWLRK